MLMPDRVARDLQQQSGAATAWCRKAAGTGSRDDLRKAMVYSANTRKVLNYARAHGMLLTDDLHKAFKLAGSRKWKGMSVAVETPAGGVRQWTDAVTGEKGLTFMLYDYGYLRGTDGVDGDKVDVFMGPDPENAPNVYVVRQLRMPEFRYYDEDKCMIGFPSREAATASYLAHYNDPRFMGPVDEYVVPLFIAAVKATKKAPAPVGGWLDLQVPQKMGDHPLVSAALGDLFVDVPEQKYGPTPEEQQSFDDMMALLARVSGIAEDTWSLPTTLPDDAAAPLVFPLLEKVLP